MGQARGEVFVEVGADFLTVQKIRHACLRMARTFWLLPVTSLGSARWCRQLILAFSLPASGEHAPALYVLEAGDACSPFVPVFCPFQGTPLGVIYG